MTHSVYHLSEANSGSIVYVGVTTQPLESRLAQHLSNAKKNKHVIDKWVQSVDFKVKITPIHVSIDFIEKADFYERHYINLYRTNG